MNELPFGHFSNLSSLRSEFEFWVASLPFDDFESLRIGCSEELNLGVWFFKVKKVCWTFLGFPFRFTACRLLTCSLRYVAGVAFALGLGVLGLIGDNGPDET